MKNVVFITGNQHKADYLAKWLGLPVAHQKVELDEIQSLNLREIAEHKARQAFAVVGKPVLVEDVALTFDAMGQLPGPLIKWFLQELDVTGLAQLAAGLPSQAASASIVYALFDGRDMQFFEATVPGTIAAEARGTNGFGWGAVFIPEGNSKTYAEMTDNEARPFNMRAQAIDKLRAFLQG